MINICLKFSDFYSTELRLYSIKELQLMVSTAASCTQHWSARQDQWAPVHQENRDVFWCVRPSIRLSSIHLYVIHPTIHPYNHPSSPAQVSGSRTQQSKQRHPDYPVLNPCRGEWGLPEPSERWSIANLSWVCPGVSWTCPLWKFFFFFKQYQFE